VLVSVSWNDGDYVFGLVDDPEMNAGVVFQMLVGLDALDFLPRCPAGWKVERERHLTKTTKSARRKEKCD
jgi:hypothetical protein